MKFCLISCLLSLLFFNTFGQTSDNTVLENDSIIVQSIPYPCELLDEPKEFKILSNSSILMTAGPASDLHNPADGSFYKHNAPKFLFTPDATNFDFSAKVKPGFDNLYDGGAILVWSNEENWAKVLIQNTGKKSILGISVVENKITDDSYFSIDEAREIYLRITRKEKVFNFYSSPDGKVWTLIREFVYHKPAQIKIGFYSQSPVGSECKVEYSDISYR